MSYYFDQKGTIKLELLDETAEEKASIFARQVSSTQLKRFFNEVKLYQKRLLENDTDERFDKLLPLIKMLKSKVYYAKGKKTSEERVSIEFVRFLTECIDSVKTKEDYKAFVLHFEAVVGFYYKYN